MTVPKRSSINQQQQRQPVKQHQRHHGHSNNNNNNNNAHHGVVFKSFVVFVIVVAYLNYRASDSMSKTTQRSVHEHTTIIVERPTPQQHEQHDNDFTTRGGADTAAVDTAGDSTTPEGNSKQHPNLRTGPSTSSRSSISITSSSSSNNKRETTAKTVSKPQLPQFPRRPYPPIVDNDMSDNPELQTEWSLWADKPMTGSFRYQPSVLPSSSSSSSSRDFVTSIYLPSIDIATIYDAKSGTSTGIGSSSWLTGNNGASSSSYRPPSPKIQELASNMVSDGTGPTDSVLLTRRGHKGGGNNGRMQPNQDRIMMLSRPKISSNDTDRKNNKTTNHQSRKQDGDVEDWWIGLFDGHGVLGHCASQYASLEFAKRIESEWNKVESEGIHEEEAETTEKVENGDDGNNKNPREGSTVAVAGVQNLLESIFEDVNESMPHFEGSGSTGISVWKVGNLVYTSNVGDSLAFVASYDTKSSKNRKGGKLDPSDIEIIYETQPHKPDSRRERERIEKAGGEVADPPAPGFSARLLIPHPNGIDMTGLAMSRSLGDFEATKYGLIARPTTMALDLRALDKNREYILFAVTDGLVDKVPPLTVAQRMAEALIPNVSFSSSLSDKGTIQPLEAAEQLILKSSDLWSSDTEEFDGGLYRDDISLVARRLHVPP
mmetsp:Transcript_22098/g.51948  ORF Transcript_22098/g.51948 Transcript_22098/m.51948 type:complete len:658 (-) Transcript_22098:53-2026(-)